MHSKVLLLADNSQASVQDKDGLSLGQGQCGVSLASTTQYG